MNHKLFRLCVWICLLCLPVFTTARAHAADPSASRRPNIVFILADDLGYAELGSYGQKKIRTPHLDQLRAEGMKFTRAYSGNAVCAPSRCVLMTGMHPGHAYIRSNREFKPEGQEPIPAETVTLAKRLQARGYVTGAFGKWGLGGPGSSGDPMNQGFDRFYGYNCQRVAHSYYPPHLWSDREKILLDNHPPVPGHGKLAKEADPNSAESYRAFQGKDYAPDRINAEALKFVRDHKDEPFFLYYPTVIPHLALHVPDEELTPYLKLGWKDPPFTADNGGYTPHFTPRAAYAAMITRMDRYIGNVLKLLDELNLADNTLVIFSSDNGATHLNREVDVDFFDSVAGLRGLKGELYEGGVRVPMIARWPGRIKAGSTTDRVVGFEDVMPTVLEMTRADLSATPPIDGLSFAPTLLGQTQPERPFLYREFPSYGSQQAVWFGSWKAIRTAMNKGPAISQLYDLNVDPNETRDLAAQHPAQIKEAETLFAQQHSPSPVFPLPGIDSRKK